LVEEFEVLSNCLIVFFCFLARYGESSTAVTQTTQGKEKPTEESTRHKEGKSRCWQKGKTGSRLESKHALVMQKPV